MQLALPKFSIYNLKKKCIRFFKKVSGQKVSGFFKMYQVFGIRWNFLSGKKYQNLILFAKPDKKNPMGMVFTTDFGNKLLKIP